MPFISSVVRACFDKLRERARESRGCQYTAADCVYERPPLISVVYAAIKHFVQRSLLGHIDKYRFYKRLGGFSQTTFYFASASDEEAREGLFGSFLRRLK